MFQFSLICLFLMLMIAIKPRRHLLQSGWIVFVILQKACCWRCLHFRQFCCVSCLPSMEAIPNMWFSFSIFFSNCLLKFRLSLVLPIFQFKFSFSAVEFIFSFTFLLSSISEFSLNACECLKFVR